MQFMDAIKILADGDSLGRIDTGGTIVVHYNQIDFV